MRVQGNKKTFLLRMVKSKKLGKIYQQKKLKLLMWLAAIFFRDVSMIKFTSESQD